jgi:hypothetical protein
VIMGRIRKNEYITKYYKVSIMMFLKTITLIIVFILIVMPSLGANDEYLKPAYRDFNKVKILDRENTRVFFEGDCKKIGLDEKELTDYLRLKVKNSFANIKLEDLPRDKYKPEQIGHIKLRVWVIGVKYPVIYHIKCELWDRSLTEFQIYEHEMLGCGSKDTVPDTVKKSIDTMVEKLAIDFYKARGEL